MVINSTEIITREVASALVRMTSKTIFLSCLFWVSSLYTLNAVAKDHFPLLTYECNTEKDFLLVTNALLKDGKEKDFKYSDADGTYSPWDLVDIRKGNIIDTSSIKKECQLSSKKYTVILEPHIFNYNLDGTCGASVSIAITILNNDISVMERKPFEFHCIGNTDIITGIKVIGSTGEIKTRTEPRYKYY